MPDQFDEVAAPAAEHKQLPAEWVRLQPLLHQHGETSKALPHKRYKTILVSDGGLKTAPEAAPAHDWARHSIRILEIVDNQVRSLRKRQLIEDFRSKTHNGTYWGIRSDFLDYHVPSDPLGCTGRDPRPIAETPTRLQAMPDELQEKLINWAYAITDAALRVHFAGDLEAEYGIAIAEPTGFPYPGGY